MNLPNWPARDWRAMIALLASVLGAAVLTVFAWWLVNLLDSYATRLITEIVRDPKSNATVGGALVTVVRTIAWGLKLLLAGIVVVLLSLGLAINRRTLSANIGKARLDMSGGDDDAAQPAAVVTTTTAVTTPGQAEQP